ncbi:MAG: hypothetical protein LKM39_02965 [Chiayiivirga sp.]|nr:hypothetical protein [Chiayiivirga sp.]
MLTLPCPVKVADASLLVVHAGFWRQMAALLVDTLLVTSVAVRSWGGWRS